MRAITHSVRLALLEALLIDGPLTATRAGEILGQSPPSCSFHLRQLAKYGFIEEAAKGPGRQRPWRLTNLGMRFTDRREDPAAVIASRSLNPALRQRYFTRLQAFYEFRSGYPRRWQEVTGGSQWVLHLTPDELRELDEGVRSLMGRYHDRLSDPTRRPADSLPVEVLIFAYPVRLPEGE